MNFEFMTIDTPLPPCMPFPRALTGFPVSSTAKVMYCRMLDAMLSKGQEDENGILFVCFPVTAIAAVLSRSPMTVKRSLNELETAGLIMRVRQGVGEPNRIYVLICIFVLVGIANIIDTQILQNGAAIRTAVVFFYLANEGLSCLENAAVIGLPVPEKLKEMLAQLKDERDQDKIDKQ